MFKREGTGNASEKLEAAAKTYAERNLLYGDNFVMVGRVMQALFPNGVDLKTEDDFRRFHLFEWAIGKLTRYTQNFDRGGHADSADDAIVYLAMLSFEDELIRDAAKIAEAMPSREWPRDWLAEAGEPLGQPYTHPEAGEPAPPWIGWAGGECPVPAKALVRYLTRFDIGSNAKRGGTNYAFELRWEHVGNAGDIMRYWVVKDAPAEEKKEDIDWPVTAGFGKSTYRGATPEGAEWASEEERKDWEALQKEREAIEQEQADERKAPF